MGLATGPLLLQPSPSAAVARSHAGRSRCDDIAGMASAAAVATLPRALDHKQAA